MNLVLLALAIPGAAFVVMVAVVQLRGERFERVHHCRPPNAYFEQETGAWITRAPVGRRHHCRCGEVWEVTSSADGLWRRWARFLPWPGDEA